MTKPKGKIYFLCTGNSCRSQMAEGFGHVYLPDWDVRSAGVEVHGLNIHAVEAMAEAGIDISMHKSELIDEDFLQESDVVVTLCGDARDRCPAVPMTGTRLHWDLPDPAQVHGTDAEVQAVFQAVRNEIQTQVKDLAVTLNS